MSAPLSPLEIRLERSKRVSNLRLDFLKRIGYARTIIERYRGMESELHLHFAMDGMICATCRARNSGEGGGVGFVERMGDQDSPIASDRCEFPVFVRVGDVSEASGPLASFARLQPLDRCYMGGIDALAPSIFAPSPELVFRAYNRKLGESLRCAGIEAGQFEDQVIKSIPKVVGNLADQYANDKWRPDAIARIHDLIVGRLHIELERNGIFLHQLPATDLQPQITKVFLCPRYSFERAVEYVRGHAILPL